MADPSMSPPLFLINHVYSFRNRGDSAIVEATARYIQSINPTARIVLLSIYWQDNEQYYQDYGWQSAPLLWSIPLDKNKTKRLLIASISLGKLLAQSLILAPKYTQTSSLYRETTAILDVGGGMLFSSNRYPLQLGFYQHLADLWMGKLYKKPTIVCPQSIGPFRNRMDRLCTGWVLSQMTAVMAREQITSDLLNQMHVNHVLAPDMVLLGNFIAAPSHIVQRLLDTIKESGSKKLIGLTVLDWQWAMKGGRIPQPVVSYMERLCLALKRLAENYDIHVCIFPQVGRGVEDNDTLMSLEFTQMLRANLVNTRSTVYYAEEVGKHLTPSDLCHLYRAMDLFIASRLHSAIFALLGDTPAIGLGYQPKTIGTFSLLGLADWAMDITSFSTDDLYQRSDLILKRSTLSRQRVRAAVASSRDNLLLRLDRTIRPLIPISDP